MNIQPIIDAVNKIEIEDGDYTGEDGLLYCGKCHTPKQMRGKEPFSGKLLSIMCACKQAELDAAKAAELRCKADELRARCFPSEAMYLHTFDQAGDAPHISKARRYVEVWDQMRADGMGLLLWGNTGSGKSFTAHCIANALIDRQIPVRCVPAVELVAKLMDRETRRDEYMNMIRTVPLLIIDDVGAERDTAFAREQLCAVIDARSEAGKPLVVTTNLSLEEMRAPQDPAMRRIFDRLAGVCAPLAVIGNSRRAEAGKERLARARALLSVK